MTLPDAKRFDVPVQCLWTSLDPRGQCLLSGDKLPAAVRSTQWTVYILSFADLCSEGSVKSKAEEKNITLLWLLVLVSNLEP